MVLENTDDNVVKSQPFGVEAPYSDWQMSGEDLVDYQDKDARGLSFVFSVERLSDNDAMRKFVSVYQKPSDDNTGAYVVVSVSPTNPNDLRIYEISNTTYGNEPDDPKLFLQKVIEMADGSGMLRTVDSYSGYHLETADVSQPTYSAPTTSVGKKGTKKTFNYSAGGESNRPSNDTETSVKYSGTRVSTTNNKPSSSSPKYKSAGQVTQPTDNRSLNKTGSSVRQKTVGVADEFKKTAIGTPGFTNNILPPPKSASLITNHMNSFDEDVRAKYNDIAVDTTKMTDSNKGNIFEQPFDKVEKSTTEQMKSKRAIPNPSELGELKKPTDKKAQGLLGGISGLVGGFANALRRTQQGGQTGITPIKDAVTGYKRGLVKGSKDEQSYNKALIAKEKNERDRKVIPGIKPSKTQKNKSDDFYAK